MDIYGLQVRKVAYNRKQTKKALKKADEKYGFLEELKYLQNSGILTTQLGDVRFEIWNNYMHHDHPLGRLIKAEMDFNDAVLRGIKRYESE